jgi:hypothetical protein
MLKIMLPLQFSIIILHFPLHSLMCVSGLSYDLIGLISQVDSSLELSRSLTCLVCYCFAGYPGLAFLFLQHLMK